MSTEDERFGLIVIGGGINGAAIAREAALSGIDVLLLERDDLCSGTSATSTRLIHGGLRYLEHGEISLVRESLLEREQLLAAAPHLVEPLEIVLPLYRRSRRGPTTVRIGMWLYDLLSLGKSLPRHRMLKPSELVELVPGIEPTGLRGGAAYFDAQVRFPERLVVENALDAIAAGARIETKTEARELLVDDGSIVGVAWQNGSKTGIARASVVVNAAGPWVDQVLGSLGSRRLIGGTRGSHLVTEKFEGAPDSAIYAEAGSDGRPFFIIPWNDLYLIGTTDERDDGDPRDARISREEYDYLIAETRRLFPGATSLDERVRYTFAGIRPLPSTDGVSPGAITRKHLIQAHPEVNGLVSVIGGKLTTHRSLAVDCLKFLRRWLPVPRGSPTLDRALPGALSRSESEQLLLEASAAFGDATAARWWHTYGGRARDLLDVVRSSGELGQRVGAGGELVVAELVHAVETELASSLVDLLQRRTMIGLGPDLGRGAAQQAAEWMVRLGLWDSDRASSELGEYTRYVGGLGAPL